MYYRGVGMDRKVCGGQPGGGGGIISKLSSKNFLFGFKLFISSLLFWLPYYEFRFFFNKNSTKVLGGDIVSPRHYPWFLLHCTIY